MNKTVITFFMAVFSAPLFAADVSDYVDTAKVIAVKSAYERVSEPKQECWDETVSSVAPPPAEHSLGGALLGGLIGGVVGNQVGQGNGKTVATGAGAIAGALVGDRVGSQNASKAPETRVEKHCKTVEGYRDEPRGYDVTVSYKGHEITARMANKPSGETVRVGINILGD